MTHKGSRELLREAGYPGGRGLPPLKMLTPEWSGAIGIFLKRGLDELGVPIEVLSVDQAEFRRRVDVGWADVFRDGWIAKYPDPQNFLALFYSGSPHNAGRYANAEYDRLFENLRREPDPAERTRISRRLERILIDDTAAVFHRHERVRQFVSDRVEGWEANCTNPMNLRYYERVRIQP